MADVIVDQLAPEEVATIVQLYNQVVRPPLSHDDLTRRYQGRNNVVQMVARMGEAPVGFLIGFEEKPEVFNLWFLGVLTQHRRQGVASQLVEALESWAGENGYEHILCECFNQQRPMMLYLIQTGFDIVGLRYDTNHGENRILWQKSLT
jgi:GNAT superfamily N-acetyltransferase